MVKNCMVDQVRKMLDEELGRDALKYEGICHCPACKAAILAAALNRLPPFYVTGVMGEVHHTFQNKVRQNISDVWVALGQGIDEVSENDPNGHIALIRKTK